MNHDESTEFQLPSFRNDSRHPIVRQEWEKHSEQYCTFIHSDFNKNISFIHSDLYKHVHASIVI